MNYAVIGSGVAGIAAVEAIRSLDPAGGVTLIGDDPFGFYSRPGLAYYLTGELHDRALFPRTADDFRRLNFRYIRARVTEILRAQHTLVLENQPAVAYDRLLIAVGAQALPLEVPGANLEGVLKLDHMTDAKRIVAQARRGRTAVVIGGGITALELVEGLRARSMAVHYLLRGDRYWCSVLDEQESHIVERRLQEHGVRLHHRSEVAELIGEKGRVSGVRLRNGESLRCDLVAYAIGILPRLELARAARLPVDRGILVDEYLQTDDPAIFAAGDAAQVYDRESGGTVIDSLWAPAREQGYTAGRNMAGERTPYVRSIPFNVTRLAGLTTTIIGTVGRGRDKDLIGIARGDSETWRQLPDSMIAQTGFDVNRLRLQVGESALLGAIVMGDQMLSFPLQNIIARKMNISPIREKLLAPGAKIGDILAAFWTSQISN